MSGDLKPEENASSSRKPLLNKRIAFPLTGGATGSHTVTSSAGGFPPLPPVTSFSPLLPPTTFTPPSVAVMALNEQLSETSSVETSEQLESSLLIVSNILSNIVTNYLESDKQDDFNKRLHNLYSNWKDGKLNKDIRQRLCAMCESLEAKDFTKAENIQVSLAVDYTADCATWIVVIKNVITQMKNKLTDV